MKARKYIGYGLVAIIVAGLFGGCAAGKPETPKQLVIPPPPNEPRLHLIGAYRGESNFVGQSALDTFLGEESLKPKKDLARPYGVAGYQGKIYVTDAALGICMVIDPVAKKVGLIGDSGAGKIVSPVEVTVDKTGNVYVADSRLKRVYRYDSSGNYTAQYGEGGEFYRPTGVAVDDVNGFLYVVDTVAHDIKVYALKERGKPLRIIGKRGNGDGEFNYPTNISIDRRNGNVVVGDTQNFRIQVFDKNGQFVRKFGAIGDKPGYFARPKGVAVNSEGHIFAADAAFENVQVFDEKGNFLMFFGGSGGALGQFQLPASMEFDEDDRLYIAEVINGRVQVFQYLSESWKRNNSEAYKKILEERK